MKEHQDDRETDTNCGRKLMKPADLEEDDQGKEEKRENNTNKNEIDGEEKSQERVCHICNKKFSSGKALGGHMSSAHVQAKGQKAKSNSNSKKLLKRKYNKSHAKSVVGYDDFVDEFDEDGDYYCESLIGKLEFKKQKIGFSCRYCGKDFPSKKSLFGHMRCHPDRPYRGMDPPDCNNPDNDDELINSSMPFLDNSQFEELQGEEKAVRNQENVVDLAQALVGQGWYAKGKRGIGATANSSSATENSNSIGNDEFYEDEVDSYEERYLVSHLLMHLHNSGGSRFNRDAKNVVMEAEAGAEVTSIATPRESPSEGDQLFLDFAMSKKTGDKSERTCNEEEAKAAGGVMNQLKNKGRSNLLLENGKDDNSSDGTNSDDQLVRKLDYARKGKGKIVEQKKRGKYNNTKNIIIRIKDKKASSSARVVDNHVNGHSSVAAAPPPPPSPPPPSPPPPVAENGKEYRCTYCGKTFPTHQALGGHKSSHNKFKMSIHNTIDDEVLPLGMDDQNGGIKKMASDQSPPYKEGRSCKKRKKVAAAMVEVQKVLDFDLNELPEADS